MLSPIDGTEKLNGRLNGLGTPIMEKLELSRNLGLKGNLSMNGLK